MKSAAFLLLFIFCFNTKAQEKKRIKNIKTFGLIYNNTTEDNFLFNDEDYTFSSNVFKFQVTYLLYKNKNFSLNLGVQPQIHFIKHQLINEQFVTPLEEDYLTKRELFTKKKSISLYGFELGITAQQKILQNFYLELNVYAGVGYIDRLTERLAKGFTFIENGSIGFMYQFATNYQIFNGIQIGHISNFDLNYPNGGFNNLGFEIGLRYIFN